MSMVLIPVTVMVLAALVELVRPRPFGLFDFFLAFQLMFALNYFVAPLLIHAASGAADHGVLAAQIFYLPLMTRRGIDEPSLAAALPWAIVGYMAILAGYFGAARFLSPRTWWPKPLNEASVDCRALLVAASGLLIVAVLAIGVYVPSLRYQPGGSGAYYGIETFFRNIDTMRQEPAKFGFLKHVAMLAMPASLIFAAIAFQRRGCASLVAWGLGAVGFILTVLVLFHNAGRIEMIAYLVLLPLAAFIRAPRVNVYMLCMAMLIFGVAAIWALFGDNFFVLFTSPKTPEIFQAALDQLVTMPSRSLVSLLGQLSYPIVVLANTLKVIPDEIGYRLFMDLPLGLFYLLPEILIGADWPPTLNLINSAMFGFPIPIDLLSLGFFSLGYPGLALVAVMFGLLLRFLDGWLNPSGGWLIVLFRAAWLIYLPIRIMSADPYASLKSGFQLIVGTAILLALIRLSARRSTPDVES